MPNRRIAPRAVSRLVGVYPNPISPSLPYPSSILKDRDLYRPGGVYYGSDTRWPEYEMALKPQGRHRAEYPSGGMTAGLS